MRDLLTPPLDVEGTAIWPWPRGAYWSDVHPGIWRASQHPPGTPAPLGKRRGPAGER